MKAFSYKPTALICFLISKWNDWKVLICLSAHSLSYAHARTHTHARTHSLTNGKNKDWGTLMNILSPQMQWIENISFHSNTWMNCGALIKKTKNIHCRQKNPDFTLIQICFYSGKTFQNKIQCLRQTNAAHLSSLDKIALPLQPSRVLFAYLRLSQPGKGDRWRMSQTVLSVE